MSAKKNNKFSRSKVVKFPRQNDLRRTYNNSGTEPIVQKLKLGPNPSLENVDADSISDPQLTVDLKNPELKDLILKYKQSQTAENLEALLRHIMRCRILIPTRPEGGTLPNIILLRGNVAASPGKEMFFLPVFTEMSEFGADHLKSTNTQTIMNTLYINANHFALKEEKISGLAINPYTDNIVLPETILKAVDESVVQKKDLHIQPAKAPTVPKEIPVEQMTDEQYFSYEYARFALESLPQKFFEDRSALVNEIIERREEKIDELFESSYKEIRMYPYLPEEFYVLPMGLSDGEDIIQIDMPHPEKHPLLPLSIFIYYNSKTDSGRYFVLSRLMDPSTRKFTEELHIAELIELHKLRDCGTATIEGNRIRMILDICRGKSKE